jgi:hypothetical protein
MHAIYCFVPCQQAMIRDLIHLLRIHTYIQMSYTIYIYIYIYIEQQTYIHVQAQTHTLRQFFLNQHQTQRRSPCISYNKQICRKHMCTHFINQAKVLEQMADIKEQAMRYQLDVELLQKWVLQDSCVFCIGRCMHMCVWIWGFVRMCVWFACMYLGCVWVWYDIYKYIHVYIYIYIHSYIHTHVYTRIHVCMYVTKE